MPSKDILLVSSTKTDPGEEDSRRDETRALRRWKVIISMSIEIEFGTSCNIRLSIPVSINKTSGAAVKDDILNQTMDGIYAYNENARTLLRVNYIKTEKEFIKYINDVEIDETKERELGININCTYYLSWTNSSSATPWPPFS